MTLPTLDNIVRPEAEGFGALIEWGTADTETMYLRLGTGPGREQQIRTAEVPNLPNAGGDNPEDFRAELGRPFSRTEFSGGEGLDRAHRRDGTERDFRRYWDSKGIHVAPTLPGDPERFTLAHETTEIEGSANTNLHVAVIGTVLYMSEGSTVRRSTNPAAGSPTFSSSVRGGTIGGLAVLGDELYAAVGSDIERRSSGGSWSTWSTLNATACWSAKGRIMASDGTGLYEAAASAASVLVHTLPTGTIWTSVVDAGAAILAAATDGFVYSFAEEEGNLVLKGQTLIEGGEIPYSLAAIQGIVLIGTGEDTTGGGKIGRMWRAQLVGVRLQAGEVIRQWGSSAETLDRAPYWITTTRESAYWGIIEDGSDTAVWKFMAETLGVARELVATGSGIVRGATVIDERVFFTVSADGMKREQTTFETTGYMIGPIADFYSAASKAWVGARLETDGLITQETADLFYSTDPDALVDPAHASWTSGVAVTAASGSGSGQLLDEQPISEVEGRSILVKIVLTPSTDQTTAPEVLSYTVRALTGSTDVTFQFPINVSDQLEMPNRKVLHIPGEGDRIWQQLRTLEGTAVRVETLRPAASVRGQLRSVSTPIPGISTRGSPTMFCLLIVDGIKLT